MIKNNVRIVIITVLIATISGFLGYTYYVDVNALSNIEITINDISFQELHQTYCKLKLSININNLADQEITDITAKFDINIANNYIGSGSFSRISIPAKSMREKDVPITIYYANVASAVVEGIKKGNFDVTIEGEIKANVLFNLITVSQEFKALQTYP